MRTTEHSMFLFLLLILLTHILYLSHYIQIEAQNIDLGNDQELLDRNNHKPIIYQRNITSNEGIPSPSNHSNHQSDTIEVMPADLTEIERNDSDIATPTSILNIELSQNKIASMDTVPKSQDIVINDGLPPIFVLNLDRSKDRWQHATEEMAKANLLVNRFSAVDGRALTKAELRKYSTPLATFFQPRGVIGCYLSHIKFWRMVVEQNYSHAIVFEDDVKLVPDFKEQMNQHMKELEGYVYDVAFIGAIGLVHPQGKETLAAKWFSTYIGGGRKFRRLSEHLYQGARPAGTHAYIVTNQGARKLLKLCPKAVFHVDLDAWRHRSLNMIVLDPMLAHQTFDSTELTDFNIKTIDSSISTSNSTDKSIFSLPNTQSSSSSDSTLLASSSSSSSSLSSSYSSSLAISNMLRRLSIKRAFSSLSQLTHMPVDNHTKQPLSHIFAEPLLQFGPKGAILTVGRHVVLVVSGVAFAAGFQVSGYAFLAKATIGAVVTFTASVRLIIWLLMNVK